MEQKNLKVTQDIILSKVKTDVENKLVIPDDVEKAIRNYCALSPNKEWSGILFYTFEGDFNSGLILTCKNILLLNQGNSVFTEFNANNPDIANYMFRNGLLNCCMGLIHSHNTMKTFFSGQDTETLKLEGNDCNNFLSLIVNNEGTYTAAITKKIEYEAKIESKIKETGKYTLFNTDNTVVLPVTSKTKKESCKRTVIEYVNLDIVKNDSITADESCILFNKVSNIKSEERYNPYTEFKSFETQKYNKNKEERSDYNTPFERRNGAYKAYNDSLFYPINKKDDYLIHNDDDGTDEYLTDLKYIDSTIDWNTNSYLAFLEQISFGCPFIKTAKCKNETEELKYLQKNAFIHYSKRFTNLDVFFDWFSGVLEFYLFEDCNQIINVDLSGDVDEVAIVAYHTKNLLESLPGSLFVNTMIDCLTQRI